MKLEVSAEPFNWGASAATVVMIDELGIVHMPGSAWVFVEALLILRPPFAGRHRSAAQEDFSGGVLTTGCYSGPRMSKPVSETHVKHQVAEVNGVLGGTFPTEHRKAVGCPQSRTSCAFIATAGNTRP